MKRIEGYKVVTLILVFIICFSAIAMNMKCLDRKGTKAEQQERECLEENFLEEIKAVLETEDLYKSGVTMTKIEEEKGKNEYQVLIHNEYILRMPEDRREKLKGKLEKLSFPDGSSKVSHIFLEI